jgi:predicted Zn-dependent protease
MTLSHRRGHLRNGWRIGATLLLSGAAWAADLGAFLEDARSASPAANLAAAEAWPGPPQALVAVVRGQALLALDRLGEAGAAFTQALELDPHCRPAHRGLAHLAARREDWPAAARAAAAGTEWDTATAEEFAFLAQVALRAGDHRLASVALTQGLLRFPLDDALRRLDIALLAHHGADAELLTAVRSALARTPTDADLWGHRAAVAQRNGHNTDAIAALEVAWLADPSRPRRIALAQAQAAAGLGRAAWAHWQALEPANAAEARWGALAAESAGQPDAGLALLARHPAPSDRAHQVLAARLALAAGHPQDARRHLGLLIAEGAADGAVLVWAGSLAEQAGDLTEAEASYRHAGTLPDDPQAASARLRLAALLLRQDRHTEAHELLDRHRRDHPGDPTITP